MAETTNKEVYQPMTFDAIKIGLASPEKIREWSHGEVKTGKRWSVLRENLRTEQRLGVSLW